MPNDGVQSAFALARARLTTPAGSGSEDNRSDLDEDARRMSNPFATPTSQRSADSAIAERAASLERRASATPEQDARLREAVDVLERDVRRRQSFNVERRSPPQFGPQNNLVNETPRSARAPSRTTRRSLDNFFAMELRRQKRLEHLDATPEGDSGQVTPVPEPPLQSVSTNSLQSLSATTQDIADLETLRRQAVRRRDSMRAALEQVDEDVDSMSTVAAHLRPSDDSDRQAFGLGTGWSIVTPEGPPAQAVQRALAFYSEESESRQSFIPVIKTIPTVAGKISVALGADMLTLGLSNGNSALRGGGSAAIAAGVLMVVGGMASLMFDMRKINPKRVQSTLIMTTLGMLITTTGLVVGETDLGARHLHVRTISAVVIGVGLTLLNTTLPLSFAYSELVHGDTFRSYRNEVAFLVQGIGLGVATGLTLSRGAPRDTIKPTQFPFGVAHALAVLGIAMNTFGTCLTATNLQRTQGRFVALRTRLRQVARQVRTLQGSPPQP